MLVKLPRILAVAATNTQPVFVYLCHQNMPRRSWLVRSPIIPWSFSSWSAYRTCPRQFYEMRVAKNFVQPQSEAIIWGNEVHKALELRAKENAPLPDNMARFQPVADKIIYAIGDTYAEIELGATEDLQPAGFWDSSCWCRGKGDLIKVNNKKAIAFDWKGLPLDTLLPCPKGFVKMADVRVGDKLYSSKGTECTVLAKSSVHDRQLYNISFDDKTNVVCDDQHLWATVSGTKVVTQLTCKDDIVTTEPVQYPTNNELPLDPYVLGLWLADGKHTSGEITKPDQFVWDEIERRGYKLGMPYYDKRSGCRTQTVLNIRSLLYALGVAPVKQLPLKYIFSSVQQRLDLLRGIMDGDGSVNPLRKQCVFTTTDKKLSDRVKLLLESLGERVNQSHTKQSGFGLVVDAYPLAWRPCKYNPFLLPGKKDAVLMHEWGVGNSWRRRIRKVEKYGAGKTQCVKVDSADSTYLCTKHYIPTHNTGKVHPNSLQLDLMAALVFINFPAVEELATVFVWFQRPDKPTVTRYTRDQIGKLIDQFRPGVADMLWSLENNVWPEKQSGLCRPNPRSGYKGCPVTTCKFNAYYKSSR